MNPHAVALLEQARQHLAREDRPGAAAILAAALELDPAYLPAHNLREEHRLPGNFADWTGVNSVISPDDDIYRFFAGHPDSRNPLRDYIADGWRTLSELSRVLDSVGKSLFRCPGFLEFAAGHGRFTRHLAMALPPGTLTVSDVVPGSVAFLRQHWGVKGFESTAAPEALNIPDTYDVVFVLSLFSHLPDSSWRGWLAKLYSAVAPAGVLLLTTHGEEAARKTGVDCGQAGYAFFSASESKALLGTEYGTIYTSAQYVKQALSATAARAKVTHIPAAFWNYQDAWILQRG